jgi:hypothetical protein
MRNHVYITCFLLGFFRLSVISAQADSPSPSPDWLTPDKANEHHDDPNHQQIAPSDRKYGVGDVDIYARYAQAAHGSANGLSRLGTIGMDVHGLYGKQAGYAIGAAFDLGIGIDSSFVYGARISPIGWGLAIGPSGYLMLLGGVGIDGATSHVPASGILPVQLLLAFDIRTRVRLGFDAGVTWVTNSDRENGARILSSGDELDLGTFIRVGSACDCGDFNLGRGYFFRLDRKDQMGTTFFGLAFGLEIDASG